MEYGLTEMELTLGKRACGVWLTEGRTTLVAFTKLN